nr:hypothetical protein [Tanacetum cinerariifolium]
FGDSYEAPQKVADTGSASEGSAKKKGRTVVVTTEDMQKRRNDTAQELWAAILKTFGGNEATKKTKKNQLKQQYGNFKAEGKETLEQTFNRLQAIRNRSDLDTMSLDDLYNHLKVYELEVQKKSDSQNMASSGKKEINTASYPTASTQVSPASANVATASISLDTAYAYIASQSNDSQIMYEDINQIDEDDIEEMDIKRENFKQGSKVEESAPKALMVTDEVGCDWSYMDNEEEDLALVADQEAPTKFTLMAKSSSDTEVEARLVEFKNQEIKFCEKIRGLEFSVESKNNRIERLTNELEELKKEKEGLDSKLTGFQSTSKDLDTFRKLETGLPEFANDTITDYSRPSPSIETDSPTVIKTNKDETVRKPSIKYVEMYRQTSKSSNVRGTSRPKNNTHKSILPRTVFHKSNRTPMRINRPNMNAAQPKRTSFYKLAHSYVSRTVQRKSAVRTQFRVPKVSTGNTKFPTVNKNFPTGSSTASFNGCSRHMTGNKPYLADYQEIHDGVFVAFGSSRGKITGKDGTQKGPAVLTGVAALVDAAAFGLAALIVAKASADESELWHRRLGKQHKASCKTKLVNSVTKPLHTL